MGNEISGREIILGAKKATTWRTAVACGAGDGVLIKTEGFGPKAPTFLPDDSLGQDDIMYQYNVGEALERGSIGGLLRYQGWDVLLAMALGTAGNPTQAEGTAYYNTYSPAANISGKFVTLAMKKKGTGSAKDIWEIPSAKITGFTIRGRIRELCSIDINFMGNKIENQSAVNTNATIVNVTYPTRANVVTLNSNFKVRMNAQGGAALADSDKIYPYGFELTYNRPMEAAFEAGNTDMSEPDQNGFATATLRLDFDKYNIDTFMDAIAADAAQKIDLLLKGDVITGTNNYQMRFDFPKINVKSAAAPVNGPGKISHSIELDLLAVSAAPTGMTATDPLSIYVMNTRTTDPLA